MFQNINHLPWPRMARSPQHRLLATDALGYSSFQLFLVATHREANACQDAVIFLVDLLDHDPKIVDLILRFWGRLAEGE